MFLRLNLLICRRICAYYFAPKIQFYFFGCRSRRFSARAAMLRSSLSFTASVRPQRVGDGLRRPRSALIPLRSIRSPSAYLRMACSAALALC
jgi:hypothetical protein